MFGFPSSTLAPWILGPEILYDRAQGPPEGESIRTIWNAGRSKSILSVMVRHRLLNSPHRTIMTRHLHRRIKDLSLQLSHIDPYVVHHSQTANGSLYPFPYCLLFIFSPRPRYSKWRKKSPATRHVPNPKNE